MASNMADETYTNSKFIEFLDTEKYPIDLALLLNHVVAKNPSIWENVGILLRIDKGVLDGIKMNISLGGNPKNHFREVLSIWERSLEPPFNWCTILSILSAPIIDCSTLADEIAAVLNKKDSSSTDGGIRSDQVAPSSSSSSTLRELTALNAVQLLRDCDFRMFTNWSKVSRSLGISLDDRNRLKHKGMMSDDWSDVMESALTIWIDSGQATWDKLIEAVESEEKNTALKMKRILYKE